MWNSKQDETGIEVYEETKSGKEENQPSFFMSLLPVILPVILILIGTVVGAVMEETPGWISFISNKSIALLIGALVAYLVSSKNMNRDEREASVTEALKSCGIVLMITGAGGSFRSYYQCNGSRRHACRNDPEYFRITGSCASDCLCHLPAFSELHLDPEPWLPSQP